MATSIGRPSKKGRMLNEVMNQVEWILSHAADTGFVGGTPSGYIQHYGTTAEPKWGTMGGPIIYEADMQHLRNMLEVLTGVKTILCHYPGCMRTAVKDHTMCTYHYSAGRSMKVMPSARSHRS